MNRKADIFIVILIIITCIVTYLYTEEYDAPLTPVTNEEDAESEIAPKEKAEEVEPEKPEPTPTPYVEPTYTNIALIGIDSRTNEVPDRANTDTMIIASINDLTGDVRMVSIYRDTLLNIGSKDPESDLIVYDKANAAYANGGAEQFIRMVKKNLDIDIDEYVVVNFAAVAKMVDAIGGIDVWMTKEEVIHMNNYCVETSSVTGMDYEPIEPDEEPRDYHLTGVQAVSYARIRYTAGNDMKRTQRQRVVIEKVIDKVKQDSFGAARSLIMDVAPSCKTSMDIMEIIGYAMDKDKYKVEKTCGFPTLYLGHQTYTNGKSLDPQIPITLEKSVRDIHAFLFDDMDYEPTEEIMQYNNEIIELTGLGEDAIEAAERNSRILDSGGEADVVK